MTAYPNEFVLYVYDPEGRDRASEFRYACADGVTRSRSELAKELARRATQGESHEASVPQEEVPAKSH